MRPSAYFLRDFVMKTCDAGGVARFADGERVAFFGDSITQNIARDYLRDKPQEAALRARVEEIQS